MKNKRFDIIIRYGQLLKDSYDLLKEAVLEARAMQDAKYRVTFEKVSERITLSRYKYYFDYVMFQILVSVGESLAIVEPGGIIRPVRNTDEVHFIMKSRYNPVTYVDKLTGKSGQVGITTKILPDTQFIGKYMESIMSDFADAPYFVEFVVDYEDWKLYHKAKEWKEIKENIKNGITV